MPPPSTGDKHLDILLDVRDRVAGVQSDIGYVREWQERTDARLTMHSDKFETIEKDTTTKLDAIEERITPLETARRQSELRWGRVSEPVKLAGTVLITLAATGIWEWASGKLNSPVKGDANATHPTHSTPPVPPADPPRTG